MSLMMVAEPMCQLMIAALMCPMMVYDCCWSPNAVCGQPLPAAWACAEL